MSDMQDELNAARELPPFPSWHDFHNDWSQIEQDLKRAATDGLSKLSVEALARVRQYPYAVLEAARARVMTNAPPGSSIEAALGLWQRMYHVHPAEMSEIRTALVEFWVLRR